MTRWAAKTICDDGDACSGPDFCIDGKGCAFPENAQHTGQQCGKGGANTICKDGKCQLGCQNAKDCDDGNVCTDDACNAGKCGNTANIIACDDKQTCTTNDTCKDAACLAGGERYWEKTAIDGNAKWIALGGRFPDGTLVWHHTEPSNGQNDVRLRWTDVAGKEQQRLTFGGAGDQNSSDVAVRADGAVFVCGNHFQSGVTANTDLALWKVDSQTKTVAWTAVVADSTNEQWCRNVVALSDKGAVTFGGRCKPGNDGSRDGVLRHFNDSGKQTWVRLFDAAGQDTYDYDQAMIPLSDGKLAICMQSFYNDGSRYNAWYARIDPGNAGQMVDSANFHSSGSNDEACHAMAETDAGNILLVITTGAPGGASKLWLIEAGPGGKKVWETVHSDTYKESGYHRALRMPHGGGSCWRDRVSSRATHTI